jgi:hypothetical protein
VVTPADDYLFCGPLIIQRLKEQVPGLVEVLGAKELASIQDDAPVCPAAYVIYSGDAPGTTPAATGGIIRQVQSVSQFWAILLAVQLADSRGLGDDVNEVAGPWLAKIMGALRGWVPVPGITTPLARAATALQPMFGDDGYAYYPVVFQATFIDR